tara:strand:- start:27 stop:221 length:195 start_codon:yes stop_codon:yes gene_type:complete
MNAGASTWAPSSPTSQTDKEEAAQIVAKANEDHEARKKDAAKVAGGSMSKEELQALIDAKTKKR